MRSRPENKEAGTWQRCQIHLQHNTLGYAAKLDQRVFVACTIRSIFNAPDVNEANRLLGQALRAGTVPTPNWRPGPRSTWTEDLRCLACQARLRMRTTNGLKRLNKEIKRRTRVATLFPTQPVACD